MISLNFLEDLFTAWLLYFSTDADRLLCKIKSYDPAKCHVQKEGVREMEPYIIETFLLRSSLGHCRWFCQVYDFRYYPYCGIFLGRPVHF